MNPDKKNTGNVSVHYIDKKSNKELSHVYRTIVPSMGDTVILDDGNKYRVVDRIWQDEQYVELSIDIHLQLI